MPKISSAFGKGVLMTLNKVCLWLWIKQELCSAMAVISLIPLDILSMKVPFRSITNCLQTGRLQYLTMFHKPRRNKAIVQTHHAGQHPWQGRVPAASSAGSPSPSPRLHCTAPGGGHPGEDAASQSCEAAGWIWLPPTAKGKAILLYAALEIGWSVGSSIVLALPTAFPSSEGILLGRICGVCFVWLLPLCMRCIKVWENHGESLEPTTLVQLSVFFSGEMWFFPRSICLWDSSNWISYCIMPWAIS